jgi:cytochrome bd-type quinol oxidase subunit 1
MNYPFWDVPHISGGWVIGLVAIFHVMISHFAVGGGFYLALAEHKARREGRSDWLEILRAHSKFFLILTGVFGAVSGVGIWFAIGLAHPEATSTLIHNFVFAWAIEWVFFLVELTTAAVYYYSWGRIPARQHLQVGWLYALASFFTLVIINGILAFMLTPGQAWLEVAGTGKEATRFWPALLNPTYWPNLLLRTLVCIALAAVWALVTCSRIKDPARQALKAEIVRWSTKWLILAFVLLPAGLFWYLSLAPENSLALLKQGVSTVGPGLFTQATRVALIVALSSSVVVAVAYLLAYRSPADFGLSQASVIVALVLVATGSGEATREMLRKPYVISQHMFSNGVRVRDVARLNQEGYLRNTIWMRSRGAPVLAQGEAMFRGQCAACHTRDGYRSMKRLLAERNRETIGNLLKVLHEYKEDSPYRRYMPPLVGVQEEVAALGEYLATLTSATDQAANQSPEAASPASSPPKPGGR